VTRLPSMSIRAAELWYFYIRTVETASDAATTVMSAETEFPCHRSNAMNGKTAFVLLSGVLSGSLCACVQAPDAAAPTTPPPPVEAAAPTTPPPPQVVVPAPAPAPVAEPTPGNQWVSIQGALCEKAAGVVARRSRRGSAVLYGLSGSALP
jgi:outer membrane biosynthesis protein TonB